VVALSPQAEQLPALANMLGLIDAAFLKRLAKVESGEFKARPGPPKNPERALRECHPGLWRQL
jgi:hypothetical protein